MKNTNKFYLSHIIFVGILLIFAGFTYWLISESEPERASNFFHEYKLLVIQGKSKEAEILFDEALSHGDDSQLDEIWLPLVLSQEDGYDKLINYSRLLAGNTEREATYEEISNLITRSPKDFQENLKEYYLVELLEIPDVRIDLLRKSDLYVEK